MDEWSLHGLSIVLSKHHIPLQAPALIGHKVDIPSALIESLHHTEILVKALTLFFTEVSTILWKIVQMAPKEVHFHLHARPMLVEILN